MLKLKGGMSALRIEMRRWHGLKREGRVCKECDSGEVENMCHWLLQCSAWDHLRQTRLEAMDEVRKLRLLNKDCWRQTSPYIITCMSELSYSIHHYLYVVS